ncbi:hypothetical protein, partial [Streptomyces sp. NPDC058812]|uniref:hypothetical protein n=1 Tax=Streptomyces sp. NPDC058812 TaxID=3346639 RepID=UPI0036B21305
AVDSVMADLLKVSELHGDTSRRARCAEDAAFGEKPIPGDLNPLSGHQEGGGPVVGAVALKGYEPGGVSGMRSHGGEVDSVRLAQQGSGGDQA